MNATTTTRSMVDVARALTPELSARALEGERLGTLPADLAARAKADRLFALALPAALGGLELAPEEIVRVLEEVCYADGSAGWSITIGNGTSFFAWLEPSVAAELVCSGDIAAAGSFGPNGRLTPDGPGYVLDGRWTFSSGCRHSDWFFNGAFPFDGDAPRMVEGRGPDWRLAVIPAGAVEIDDNWDVSGLRGTGSHDISVHGLRVPEEHTFAAFFEPARHDGALYRLPFFTLIGVLFAAVPLGVGRRALEEITTLAQTKARVGSFVPMGQEDDVQVALAQAEGRLLGARSFVFDALGELWDQALAGDVPSRAARARFQLAAKEAMRAGLSAVDAAFALAGAGAVFSDQPLQRCFRDLHTASQHIYFSPAADKRYARERLGIEQPAHLM